MFDLNKGNEISTGYGSFQAGINEGVYLESVYCEPIETQDGRTLDTITFRFVKDDGSEILHREFEPAPYPRTYKSGGKTVIETEDEAQERAVKEMMFRLLRIAGCFTNPDSFIAEVGSHPDFQSFARAYTKTLNKYVSAQPDKKLRLKLHYKFGTNFLSLPRNPRYGNFIEPENTEPSTISISRWEAENMLKPSESEETSSTTSPAEGESTSTSSGFENWVKTVTKE